jgi:hypothetical protein
MSIEKKSLISTLKTTKKANAVKDDISGGATVSPAQKLPVVRALNVKKPALKKPALKKPALKKPALKKPALKR